MRLGLAAALAAAMAAAAFAAPPEALPEADLSGPVPAQPEAARDASLPCGSRSSVAVTPMEAAGRRLALERELLEGGLSLCGYSLRRACQDWETGEPNAGWDAFVMAWRFCDDRTVPARGRVAARLEREDWAGAYADWRESAASGPEDSLALVPWEPAVFGGLSLTDFPARGPAAYSLRKNPKTGLDADLATGRDPRSDAAGLDPDRAYRLSVLPGAGFLYVGEGGLALRHFLLGAGLTALAGWRVWTGFQGPDHDARMAAFLDAAVIVAIPWRRYYLGGMREARRIAREKNRRAGAARVQALLEGVEPFRQPAKAP